MRLASLGLGWGFGLNRVRKCPISHELGPYICSEVRGFEKEECHLLRCRVPLLQRAAEASHRAPPRTPHGEVGMWFLLRASPRAWDAGSGGGPLLPTLRRCWNA